MSGSSGAATGGRRLALVVAVTDYVDSDLRQLRAPAGDAAELRDLLADPDIGSFSVTSVINEKAHQIRLAIEDFLSDRRPSDLLLVYLSCHGLVDARRRLYFAARDTIKNRLASSGIESHWLLDQLEDCRARQQVVILDCCFSGAFAQGSKGTDDLGIGERLVGQGRGRVVLTASRGTEYSFEGEPLQGEDVTRGSVFTSALIDGIRSGRADVDHDGDISVDDAYTYAFEQVRGAGTQQTPQRWLYGAEGSILLAHAPAQADPPAPPEEPLTAAEPPEQLPGEPATVGGHAGGPTGRGSRRAVYAAIGALVAAAAVVAAVLLVGNPGSSSDGSGTTTGSFTAHAPWRLVIEDRTSDDESPDVGCTVTVTSDASGEPRTWSSLYGARNQYQMDESGGFHYESSDPGCILTPVTGTGEASLPLSWPGTAGDTDAFHSPGAVSVKVEKWTSATCDLSLNAVSNLQPLDSTTVPEGGGPVTLKSGGPAHVYIADPACQILVTSAD